MSNKQHSRSNLYRSRRRLRSSLRQGGREHPPPEVWSRPAITEPSEKLARFHLLGVPRGMVQKSVKGRKSEVLGRLSLLIRPVPKEPSTAAYRIKLGSDVRGPYQVMVDANGIAVPDISTEILKGVAAISVEWEFLGQRIVRSWKRTPGKHSLR